MLERLVDAAIMAFVAAGYRRTRVAEIAKAAGIAPGTVYLYVEGKEALFELALRRAFKAPGALDVPLPYRSTEAQTHIDEVFERLLETDPLADLAAAEATEDPADPAAEFEALVRGLFRWQSEYWRGIALIEACAREWPELHLLFYREFRRGALERGAALLERRAETGHYVAFPDARVASHLIMDTVAAFAMDRHTAPDTDYITDAVAEETTVQALTRAFVAVPASPMA